MLKLYGFSYSNYYNMAKHALLYKEIEFEEIIQYATGDDGFQKKSPARRVPALETEQGCLSEASAIIEFLEEKYPDRPLFPGDAFQKAQIKQVMKMAELYIEWPARRLLGPAIFGFPSNQSVMEEVRPAMERGLEAIAATCDFSPYALGESFSAADIAIFYSLAVADVVAKSIYDWELVDDVPGLSQWQQRLQQEPVFKKIEQDRIADEAGFFGYWEEKIKAG